MSQDPIWLALQRVVGPVDLILRYPPFAVALLAVLALAVWGFYYYRLVVRDDLR